jgi:hypothetical protein
MKDGHPLLTTLADGSIIEFETASADTPPREEKP